MNGSATALDRAFAALTYVMPFTSVLAAYDLAFGRFLAEQALFLAKAFGQLREILWPLIYVEQDQVWALIVFIALFVLVVRNTSISRFIRYNVLQAILVSFVISVCIRIVIFLNPFLPLIIFETLLNVLFLGGFSIVVYGVIQSVMGRYAEIPTVSDAINTQLPY